MGHTFREAISQGIDTPRQDIVEEDDDAYLVSIGALKETELEQKYNKLLGKMIIELEVSIDDEDLFVENGEYVLEEGEHFNDIVSNDMIDKAIKMYFYTER